MAEYLVELPPREMLEAKLHEAIRLARGQVGWEARKPLKGDALALRKAACAPGSARKMNAEASRRKARERKAEALGYHETRD